MKVLAAVWSEFLGLFIDDGFLAGAIVVVVVTAAALAFWLHAPGLATGAFILGGCIVVLLASVLRGTR
jgi:hypothetical protein